MHVQLAGEYWAVDFGVLQARLVVSSEDIRPYIDEISRGDVLQLWKIDSNWARADQVEVRLLYGERDVVVSQKDCSVNCLTGCVHKDTQTYIYEETHHGWWLSMESAKGSSGRVLGSTAALCRPKCSCQRPI